MEEEEEREREREGIKGGREGEREKKIVDKEKRQTDGCIER